MATVLPARSQGWHDMDCPLHLSPSSFPKPSSEPFHSSPACSPDLPDPIPPKVSSSNNRQYPGPLRAGCCCLLPCPSTNSINIRPGTGTLATFQYERAHPWR
ncbi:hypothetical protein CCHR01_12392 [Colletotrichum chrysophilum]|uniref:Uncharacterized protein n=1 Tax=Colletotrichum chrysophilum TaxID=1836956 RepID=A0AAD9EDV0_9PEZI|nr:hypothetical protein CCHR01_12392 [Colletotrichum chrysophilum]